MSKHVAYDIIQ